MLLIMNWLLLRLRIDRLTRKSTRDPPTMIDEGNSRRKRKRTGFICELAPNFPQFTIKLVRWKHESSHAFTHLVWVRLSTPTDVRMIVKFSRHQYRGGVHVVERALHSERWSHKFPLSVLSAQCFSFTQPIIYHSLRYRLDTFDWVS